MEIGFIGQGFIGQAYANNFIKRGFTVVRYGLQAEYLNNKDKIKDCEITFVAVPTPTTPAGFDYKILEEVLALISRGKIVVIKSTILPGTTEKLQNKFPDIYLLHSPEFLTEKTCQFDADFPKRNIIGTSAKSTPAQAQMVMDVLPRADYNLICQAAEAEIIKYASNCFLYLKVLFTNTLWDICSARNIDYQIVKEAMIHDPRIGLSHNDPVHAGGRGAGGHCFVKDFAAYRELYETSLTTKDGLGQAGLNWLKQAETYNLSLLKKSEKNLDLLKDIYGDRYDLN
ncbi:MAG: hypothetical protein NTX66_00900 [Candidatus Falkowbacteria bacterium]|nr:hypothetical protein [Candidatus Falkowbacteria bacterium]